MGPRRCRPDDTDGVKQPPLERIEPLPEVFPKPDIDDPEEDVAFHFAETAGDICDLIEEWYPNFSWAS